MTVTNKLCNFLYSRFHYLDGTVNLATHVIILTSVLALFNGEQSFGRAVELDQLNDDGLGAGGGRGLPHHLVHGVVPRLVNQVALHPTQQGNCSQTSSKHSANTVFVLAMAASIIISRHIKSDCGL